MVQISEWSSSCGGCSTKFPFCVASGKTVFNAGRAWVCESCRHRALDDEVRGSAVCPLCHNMI